MEQLDIFAPGNKIWNEGFKMISTKSGTQLLYEARRFEVDGARGSIPSISTTTISITEPRWTAKAPVAGSIT